MIIKVGTEVETDLGRGKVLAITERFLIVDRTDTHDKQEDVVIRGYQSVWIPAEFEKGTNCEDGHWQWVPETKETK